MELNLQGLTLGSLAYQVQRHMLTNGGWSSTDIGRFVLQKMELAYSIEASTLYKNLHSSSDAAIYDGALDSETIRILSGERDVSGRKVEDFELRVGFHMLSPMQFFLGKYKEGLGSSD
ncbi:uncharacterized protein L3040_002668 [Drepanopeziza brunnea f. sp. 'multigermtubi']|nr:hypothetical protein L3040_002668 [Drepanopeziza brunnea f. sp. 'multigermtubi']